MPLYSFFLINHLGEPFDASERSFDNDQDACAHALTTSARRGYPVDVKSGGARIKLVPLMTWRAEDWLDQTRTPTFFTKRGVHPRSIKPPACIRCRASMPPESHAKLCEGCRGPSGKAGVDH